MDKCLELLLGICVAFGVPGRRLEGDAGAKDVAWKTFL